MARSLLGALMRPVIDKAPPYVPRSGNLGLLAPGRVNAEQSMAAMSSVGTLFAIVSRLANATGQVEWKLWRKAASGLPEDRTEVPAHPALVVWNRPNNFMVRAEYVESVQQHVDLVGEGWWIVGRSGSRVTELWPARPDRMTPVPDPEKFLRGYIYTSPDGIKIPLDLDEVIMIRCPNPLDIYRGMGPVQTILNTLDSVRYSSEWNRNFFLNSAEPGGIIEVEERLSDAQYDEMRDRWAEQHRGVNKAHRVAILEDGAKWVDRKYTMKDMQFTELNQVSREVIREAFGFPKPMLGTVEDVNRANADAAAVVFARWLLVPRLERLKQALNNDFLPLFGPDQTRQYEFDYVNPVDEDREADNAERTSKANAAKVYIDLGFDPAEVLEMLGLPKMSYEKPEPVVPQLPPGADPDDDAIDNVLRVPAWAGRPLSAVPVSPGAAAVPRWWAVEQPPELPDVAGLQEDWEAVLAALMAQWPPILAAQRAELVDQVRRIAAGGSVADLTTLRADSGDAQRALLIAMTQIALLGGQRVQAEAAAQGVPDVPFGVVPTATLAAAATVTAAALAAELAVSAARAAMLANGAGAMADEIAEAVRGYLAELSDANARTQFGGALTGAQNAGRIATLKVAPEGALYASEVNDKNTCKPCKDVDGTFLGNISEMTQVEKSYPGGAYGAYVYCQGRARCRGTIVGVWRPKRVGGDG